MMWAGVKPHRLATLGHGHRFYTDPYFEVGTSIFGGIFLDYWLATH
jgi:hypothetical protein